MIVTDALDMRAVSEPYGIPEAAVMAVAAGTDLLCFGRDAAEDSYLAVRERSSRRWRAAGCPRSAWPGAAEGAPAAGLAGRRRPAAGESGRPGDHIGLVAARRAVRASSITAGAVPGPLADPVVVELGAQENMAVGDVPWGLRSWVPAASIERVPAGLAVSAAAAVAGKALARAAGRALIVVVRDAHRYPAVRAVVSELAAARPDTVVLEMGLPLWVPPAGVHLATYGAARANAQAAAEVLGLPTLDLGQVTEARPSAR